MSGTGSLYLRDKTNLSLYRMFEVFLKYFLPPVIHPEIVSGMGIATNNPFGTESSLSSNDMTQFLLEQVMK